MPDIAVVANEVQAAEGTPVENTRAKVATTAGQLVQPKDSNGEVDLCSNATQAGARVHGIALNSAGPGQPLQIARPSARSIITLGTGVMTAAERLVCSATSGGIAQDADLVSTNFVTTVGVAVDADSFLFEVAISGAQVP